MIPTKELIEALNIAVDITETNGVIPITPLGLWFSDQSHFNREEEMVIRGLLLEIFDIRVVVDPGDDTICVGQLPGQDIYLLAQTDEDGRIVYLISPSPNLD